MAEIEILGKSAVKRGSPASSSGSIGSAIVMTEPKKAIQKRIEKLIFFISRRSGGPIFSGFHEHREVT
jgi:hypothetical protein